MMNVHRPLVVVVSLALAACTDWVPVQNASDVPQGHALKIETTSGEVVVSGVVTCDPEGVIVAKATDGCACKEPGCRIDLRRTEVLVHKPLLSTGASIVGAIAGSLVILGIILVAGT